jgi:hypothetical protein
MSELTTSQIIKIVIGVFVLAIVIIGVAMAWNNYIMPWFKGYTIEDKRDLSTSFYQNLVNEKNVVAYMDEKGGGVLYLNNQKTDYYFTSNKREIKEKMPWYKFDKGVAKVDNNFKINVNGEYLQKDSRLSAINGGELINNVIYVQGGVKK